MEKYFMLCVFLVFGADSVSVEERLVELERVVKLQTETIAKHESVIQDQMVPNDRSKQGNNELKTRVENQEAYIKKMNADPENIAEKPNGHVRSGIDRRPLEKLKKRSGEIRHGQYSGNFSTFRVDPTPNHRIKRQEGNVAFYAYLSSKKCFEDNDTVVFDTKELDHGGGYADTDGIYTVPASGTYVFTWTITSDRNVWFVTEIIVEADVRSSIMSITDKDTVTGIIVVDVNEQAHVFIRKATGNGCTILANYPRSSFSGWKLF